MWRTRFASFKNVGIFALLIAVIVLATALEGNFVAAANLKTLIRDTSLYGLISIGVAMVIITGGIDLSIGSMVALAGVMTVQVLNVRYERLPAAFELVAVQRDVGPDVRERESSGANSPGWERSDQALTRLTVRPVGEVPADGTGNEFATAGLLVRRGDRVVFDGLLGESTVYLNGSSAADRKEHGAGAGRPAVDWWSADPARSLRPGMTVGLEKMVHTPPLIACGIVLLAGAALGWLHGALVTRARLQPFVVTLCGLLVYRGLARVWTGDDQVGLGSALSQFKSVVTGSVFSFPLPWVSRLSGDSDGWWDVTWIDFPFTGVLLIIVAAAAYFFLQHTVAGRHLLASGENEQAARYSGIATKRLITSAYVISGLLAAAAGILFLMEWNSVQPGSSGNFYELYAIAAAVLGGCSLRGGRGAVFGVIAGAAVMRCLYKAIVVLGIDQQWEMVIIGAALLSSVLFDELLRRWRVWRDRQGFGASTTSVR